MNIVNQKIIDAVIEKAENVRIYDKYLQKYEAVYPKAGIEVKRFAEVDVFVTEYLNQ